MYLHQRHKTPVPDPERDVPEDDHGSTAEAILPLVGGCRRRTSLTVTNVKPSDVRSMLHPFPPITAPHAYLLTGGNRDVLEKIKLSVAATRNIVISVLCAWLDLIARYLPVIAIHDEDLALRSTPRATEPAFVWNETKIAFGDSYSFIQGTAGLLGFTFIGSGRADQIAFTPEELLTNEILQSYTATAEGGPNWLEFLTGCGLENGTLPSTCDVQLWDFACAGAAVSDEYLPRHADYVNPLVNQTQQYLTYAEPVIGVDMDKSKALVAIWIGINDVVDTVNSLSDSIGYKDFWSEIISAIFSQSVQPMYDAGYRDFLLLNLPPLDRTSANQKLVLSRPSTRAIRYWNEKLAGQADVFAQDNSGANMMVYDANMFLNGVMDDPEPYGITNTRDYCDAWDEPDVATDPAKYGCEPLDQYFWFNSAHL
ncbi:uncharacterized protein JN550_006698 [Neoarthrinium moseri]|uniref:uncharacterized protein n=1 Tax=Neoarthrinium moseri TaxID=1658444 RepID=UPI001FDE2728|nr:uncharacterized protein JN550_006698 [Neoarthrinium moseri]KAI1867891.1 hypothetical protein JN550_006698 [Neoarthrinium moseri]